MSKTFEYYMSLPYKIVFYPASEGGYVAEIPDLPGCLTQGDDMQDTLEMIEDAKAAWIDIAMQDGNEIPEPNSETKEKYSGKFMVRIPKTLHKDIAVTAEKENVSINQLATYLFSEGIARRGKMPPSIRIKRKLKG